MNKNKPKPALIVAISLITIFLIAVAITTYWIYFTVHMHPKKLKAMKEYYENDANYHVVQGTVEEVVYINDVRCIDLTSVLWDDDENAYKATRFRMVMPNNDYILTALDLQKGDQIEIISAHGIFYDGYVRPIVSIKKDGVEYLSFDDGKAALLEWVNNLK